MICWHKREHQSLARWPLSAHNNCIPCLSTHNPLLVNYCCAKDLDAKKTTTFPRLKALLPWEGGGETRRITRIPSTTQSVFFIDDLLNNYPTGSRKKEKRTRREGGSTIMLHAQRGRRKGTCCFHPQAAASCTGGTHPLVSKSWKYSLMGSARCWHSERLSRHEFSTSRSLFHILTQKRSKSTLPKPLAAVMAKTYDPVTCIVTPYNILLTKN